MIKFLGINEQGEEELEVVDYSREHQGPVRITFRPIRKNKISIKI